MTLQLLEKEYCETVDFSHRKKYALFFTPEPIARLMSEWVMAKDNVKTLLEPAFGMGIFSRIVRDSFPEVDITGVEIDTTISDYAGKAFVDQACKLVLEHSDYLYSDWEEKFDGEEFSLQGLCDGTTVVATPPVQDHKRRYVGDKGPNTGGMGSYSMADHLLPFMTFRDFTCKNTYNRSSYL